MGSRPLYLWPPSFAYSKILTRGRYLSRHSRCLRATRYCKRFSRQAPWFSRSIATKSLRDGSLHAVAPTATGASPHRRRHTGKCRGHRRQPRLGAAHADGLAGGHLLGVARLLLGLFLAPRGGWGSLRSGADNWLRTRPSASGAEVVRLGGVGEGVLWTAWLRLCAPWLPFCASRPAPQRLLAEAPGRR